MFPRYNKQGASVWDRKLTIVLGLLFAVTLLLFAVWAVVLYANRAGVDDCLNGGENNRDEAARCESSPDQSDR